MRNHIQKEQDFQLLYRTGKRLSTTHTTVYTLRTDVNRHAYAVVIPNTVIPGATRRNLVRRRVRSIVYKHRESLCGKVVLVSVKKDVSRLPFSVLQDELAFVFAALKRNST